MLCLSLVPQSSLFAPSKVDYQYCHLSVCPAGQLASAKAFSSAAGEWFVYSVWKKSRETLLNVKWVFWLFIFSFRFFCTCSCKHIMKYLKLQIILSLKQSFEVLTDAILRIFLYSEVVLHKQISTFTITEIFLRIWNLQHVSPKL